jgi:membrane protease YdiL (CAAX protease family)
MAMLLIAATLLLRRNGETWASVGLRRPRSARRTAGLVIAGYLIAYALALPFAYVLIRVGHVPARGADLLVNRHGGIAEYLFWLVPAAWGLAAFGEEMLFRGFVFTRLMRLMPPGRLGLSVSLGLQSLVFGALHYAYGPGTALVAAVLGLVLGGVYLVGGRNLWAAILLHGLIDTTSISVAYFVGVKP